MRPSKTLAKSRVDWATTRSRDMIMVKKGVVERTTCDRDRVAKYRDRLPSATLEENRKENLKSFQRLSEASGFPRMSSTMPDAGRSTHIRENRPVTPCPERASWAA